LPSFGPVRTIGPASLEAASKQESP
jgi:hypothetical protein